MKKLYCQPYIKMVHIDYIRIVCAYSGVTSDKRIGYGGVDTEGDLEGASRQRCSVWEDAEEK